MKRYILTDDIADLKKGDLIEEKADWYFYCKKNPDIAPMHADIVKKLPTRDIDTYANNWMLIKGWNGGSAFAEINMHYDQYSRWRPYEPVVELWPAYFSNPWRNRFENGDYAYKFLFALNALHKIRAVQRDLCWERKPDRKDETQKKYYLARDHRKKNNTPSLVRCETEVMQNQYFLPYFDKKYPNLPTEFKIYELFTYLL